MPLTKPCGRPSCKGIVTAPGPKTLAKKAYCSVSCVIAARMEAGWRPHSNLTSALRSKGGARGGKIAGLHRRKRSIVNAASQMDQYFTPEFRDGLSEAQLARMRVLIARAYRKGHRVGYRAGYAAVRYQPRKAAA